MIEYTSLPVPLPDTELEALLALSSRVFERNDPDSIRWRVENMPALSVFVARDGDAMVAFKAGYAATRDRYYSWLGGVDPRYRGQGIAERLMQEQHRWVASSGFSVVETHVNQTNDAMVALNQKSGMKVTGIFTKRGTPNYIMQRELS